MILDAQVDFMIVMRFIFSYTHIVIGQWQKLKAFSNFFKDSLKKFSRFFFLFCRNFSPQNPKSTWHFHNFSPRDEKFSFLRSALERKSFCRYEKHFHSSRLSVVVKSRLDSNRKCKSSGIFLLTVSKIEVLIQKNLFYKKKLKIKID